VESTQIVPLAGRNTEKCPRFPGNLVSHQCFLGKVKKVVRACRKSLKISKISKNRDHHDHQRDHHFPSKMYGVTIMMVM
jgi:hypothetical protein